jgi:hypothetical protein
LNLAKTDKDELFSLSALLGLAGRKSCAFLPNEKTSANTLRSEEAVFASAFETSRSRMNLRTDSRPHSRLELLPAELLLGICKTLQLEDVFNLSRTCHGLNDITAVILYKNVCLSTSTSAIPTPYYITKHIDYRERYETHVKRSDVEHYPERSVEASYPTEDLLDDFLDTLSTSPKLGQYVLSLTLFSVWKPFTSDSLALPLLPHLHTLSVEANDFQIANLDLKSLEILELKIRPIDAELQWEERVTNKINASIFQCVQDCLESQRLRTLRLDFCQEPIVWPSDIESDVYRSRHHDMNTPHSPLEELVLRNILFAELLLMTSILGNTCQLKKLFVTFREQRDRTRFSNFPLQTPIESFVDYLKKYQTGLQELVLWHDDLPRAECAHYLGPNILDRSGQNLGSFQCFGNLVYLCIPAGIFYQHEDLEIDNILPKTLVDLTLFYSPRAASLLWSYPRSLLWKELELSHNIRKYLPNLTKFAFWFSAFSWRYAKIHHLMDFTDSSKIIKLNLREAGVAVQWFTANEVDDCPLEEDWQWHSLLNERLIYEKNSLL